jgi:hypothetical protein
MLSTHKAIGQHVISQTRHAHVMCDNQLQECLPASCTTKGLQLVQQLTNNHNIRHAMRMQWCTRIKPGGQKTLKTVMMCVSTPRRALKGNQLLINPPRQSDT